MARRSVRSSYVPARGDVIWVDFNPQVGHEQSGRRPALVLSPRDYNQRVGLALVCPITGQAKGYIYEVVLPDDLATKGVVLSDQLKSMDWRQRNAQFICQVPATVVEEAIEKFSTLLLD